MSVYRSSFLQTLEARGFILGGAIAHQLSVGFVPIRKKGKLPGAVISEEYTLEYGEAIVEVHDDAIQAGEKILLVDDLLATGGTAAAGLTLIERLGGETIGCAFVIDLPDLGGRAKLEAMGMEVEALCAFEGLCPCPKHRNRRLRDNRWNAEHRSFGLSPTAFDCAPCAVDFRVTVPFSSKGAHKVDNREHHAKDDDDTSQVFCVDAFCQVPTCITSNGAAHHHGNRLWPRDQPANAEYENAQ